MRTGDRLAELRKQNQYTQKELAQKLNVSQQIISNIERGQTEPDIDFLRDTADLYNISMDQLIGRDISGIEKDSDSIEQQIMDIIKRMDNTEKELSLGLINQVAQHRGVNNDNK